MSALEKIKLFLFDLDGTLYLGDRIIKGCKKTLEKIKKSGRRVVFLTNNSSRTKQGTLEKLKKIGIECTQEDLITSVEAACDLLSALGKDNIFVLGTKAVKEYLSTRFTLSENDDAQAVLLTFDTELTYSKLFKFVRMVDSGVFYAAANSDIYCPCDEGKMPDAGSYIHLIESITGRQPDIICGKPYRYLGDYVMRTFGLRPDEIAMVGDRLYTDIEFAVNCGFCGILVYSGETDKAQYNSWDKKSEAILELDSVADIAKLL